MLIQLMTRRATTLVAMLALAACSKADKDKSPGDQQMQAAIDSAMAKPEGVATALTDPNIKLHLYGKMEPREGRKMGHLTAIADTAEKAVSLVREARLRLNTSSQSHTG